jgi:hypothetical protein
LITTRQLSPRRSPRRPPAAAVTEILDEWIEFNDPSTRLERVALGPDDASADLGARFASPEPSLRGESSDKL